MDNLTLLAKVLDATATLHYQAKVPGNPVEGLTSTSRLVPPRTVLIVMPMKTTSLPDLYY